MPKHYLLLVLPEGKSQVRREYVELETPEEELEQAFERWISSHPDMIDRQRNREKTRRRIEGEILERRLCRPSSWAIAHRENGSSSNGKVRRK